MLLLWRPCFKILLKTVATQFSLKIIQGSRLGNSKGERFPNWAPLYEKLLFK